MYGICLFTNPEKERRDKAAAAAAAAKKAAAAKAALAKLPRVIEAKYVLYIPTLRPGPTLSAFEKRNIEKKAGIAPGAYNLAQCPLRVPYRVAATREALEEPLLEYKEANPKRLKRGNKWKAVVIRTYERRPHKTRPDVIEPIEGIGYGLYRSEDDDLRARESQRILDLGQPKLGDRLRRQLQEESAGRKGNEEVELLEHQMKMVEEIVAYRKKLEEQAELHRKHLEAQVAAHRRKLEEQAEQWLKVRQDELETYRMDHERLQDRKCSDELNEEHRTLKKREERRAQTLRKQRQEELYKAAEAAEAARAADTAKAAKAAEAAKAAKALASTASQQVDVKITIPEVMQN